MIDRDKVIIGLEKCKQYNKLNCDKCPYDYNGRGNGKSECTAELASDALALLKEQKPAEPLRVNTTYEQYWRCGFCGTIISPHDKYCHECGKEQKWE